MVGRADVLHLVLLLMSPLTLPHLLPFHPLPPPPTAVPAGTWRAFDETLSPCDPLDFVDMKPYPDRVRDSQAKTGMNDAIRTGTGAGTL
jgi:hypothetical protein